MSLDIKLGARIAQGIYAHTHTTQSQRLQVRTHKDTEMHTYLAPAHACTQMHILAHSHAGMLRHPTGMGRQSSNSHCGKLFNAGTAGLRFVPEFMKPQSLRCSTLTAPWEDQRCHIMADTRRAQEAAGDLCEHTQMHAHRI